MEKKSKKGKFSIIKNPKFPTHAMVISGEWKDEWEYDGVWCEIEEWNGKEMSLNHPQKGPFAWVHVDDCKFATK